MVVEMTTRTFLDINDLKQGHIYQLASSPKGMAIFYTGEKRVWQHLLRYSYGYTQFYRMFQYSKFVELSFVEMLDELISGNQIPPNHHIHRRITAIINANKQNKAHLEMSRKLNELYASRADVAVGSPS